MVKQLITKEEVIKISELSRLDIEGEEEMFTELFQDTLIYIQVLEELDTKNVKETYQVTGQKNVFQDPPKNTQTLTQGEALQNAMKNGNELNNLFATKAVFDR